FQMDSGEGLATGGVCGYMFHATFDGDQLLKKLGLMRLVAPYEDGKIELFMLSPDGLKPGVFKILGDSAVDGQSALVTLEARTGTASDGAPGRDDGDGDTTDGDFKISP